MKYIQIYLFFIVCILQLACNNKKDVDMSHIDIHISIDRFDKQLDASTPDSSSQLALKAKYAWFYDDYMSGMLGVGRSSEPGFYSRLQEVMNNPDYLALKQTVANTFPDMNVQEEELRDAFKRVKYHFPDQKIPRLISFISGFAVQTPVGNDYIGIGLDMFLGKNGDPFYPALRQSIPHYIARRFSPEYIAPRVTEVLIREELFTESDDDKNLLSKMIYNGKVLYLLDQFLPAKQDSLKIGYTSEQLNWCMENEGGVWAYFLGNELLYNSDYMEIQKYLAEAPFTPGMGERNESAPKLGQWIGWQIVKKYMDENPEMSIPEMLKEKDSQKFLKISKYKPRM